MPSLSTSSFFPLLYESIDALRLSWIEVFGTFVDFNIRVFPVLGGSFRFAGVTSRLLRTEGM